MAFMLHSWRLLLAILAGWVNQQQQQMVDFQRTEIDVLKEKLGRKRILLNDEQRRRLAVKGKVLGRRILQETGRLTSPPKGMSAASGVAANSGVNHRGGLS